MAAIQDIEPQLFRKRVSPMRPLAGDKRIHPFGRRFGQLTARGTRHDADAPANLRPAWNHNRFGAGGAPQALSQVRPRYGCPRPKTKMLPAVEKKVARTFQSERSAKAGIVAQRRMRIQRQMR